MIHLDIKTITFVEENVRGNMRNFALSKQNTETQIIKGKTDKVNLVKIKSPSILNRKMKR